MALCPDRLVFEYTARMHTEVGFSWDQHLHRLAYKLRAVGRRPPNPYTAGRLTSRAIQWYIVLMVCDHWVVSYTPITVAPDPPGCLTETDIEQLLEIRWS